MGSFRDGLIVWAGWLVVFLLLELPSRDVLGLWPWLSLSRTAWDAETDWRPATLFFELFLLVLAAHIVYRLSAAALIAVVCCAAVCLVAHFVFGTP